jgi:hypothetical protein
MPTKRLSKKKINKFLNGAGLASSEEKQEQEQEPKTTEVISSKSSGTVQLLEPQYDQGKGNEDLTQVTEEKEVKTILNKLVQSAAKLHVEYVGAKKNLIVSAAYHLEEYFKKTNRTQYICRISEIITHVLKTRVKRFVSDIYMRRTLDERFKNPDKRSNALQRVKSQTPGLPKDSGRTMEEIEASLQRTTDVKGLLEMLETYLKVVGNTLIAIMKQGKSEGYGEIELDKMMNEVRKRVERLNKQRVQEYRNNEMK